MDRLNRYALSFVRRAMALAMVLVGSAALAGPVPLTSVTYGHAQASASSPIWTDNEMGLGFFMNATDVPALKVATFNVPGALLTGVDIAWTSQFIVTEVLTNASAAAATVNSYAFMNFSLAVADTQSFPGDTQPWYFLDGFSCTFNPARCPQISFEDMVVGAGATYAVPDRLFESSGSVSFDPSDTGGPSYIWNAFLPIHDYFSFVFGGGGGFTHTGSDPGVTTLITRSVFLDYQVTYHYCETDATGRCAQVDEPAAWALVFVGLMGVALARRRGSRQGHTR